MSTVSCPASWYDSRVTSIVSWLDDITIIPHCFFHHTVNDIHWMQTAQWKVRHLILPHYCPHLYFFGLVAWGLCQLSTLQVFVLKLSSCPRCQCSQLMLIPWAVMCGVGSHICSDVSSVYLSVPSLSGGGLREGNALSGSNIKYIKWERMGGGGGGSEPHLPAWVLVAALCQDHCLSLCHSSHT